MSAGFSFEATGRCDSPPPRCQAASPTRASKQTAARMAYERGSGAARRSGRDLAMVRDKMEFSRRVELSIIVCPAAPKQSLGSSHKRHRICLLNSRHGDAEMISLE